jgi:hypothetical protein
LCDLMAMNWDFFLDVSCLNVAVNRWSPGLATPCNLWGRSLGFKALPILPLSRKSFISGFSRFLCR